MNFSYISSASSVKKEALPKGIFEFTRWRMNKVEPNKLTAKEKSEFYDHLQTLKPNYQNFRYYFISKETRIY